jgi:hypothetical protein
VLLTGLLLESIREGGLSQDYIRDVVVNIILIMMIVMMMVMMVMMMMMMMVVVMMMMMMMMTAGLLLEGMREGGLSQDYIRDVVVNIILVSGRPLFSTGKDLVLHTKRVDD